MKARLKPSAVRAALSPFAAQLLIAKAYAQVQREHVDKIQRAELQAQHYAGRLHDGRSIRVTEPSQSYLMDNDAAERYFAKLNAIHLAAGFVKAADGHCPALTAETLETEAEWALIKAAERFFPDVTNDKLLCGTKDCGGLETRTKYLDLLIGLCLAKGGA